MLLLGILSLFQIVVLPGFILLKLVNIKTENSLQLFLYSFGLSLYINYPIVCFLTLLKIYTSTSVYILFLIELTILYWLVYRGRIIIDINKTIKDFNGVFVNYLKQLPAIHKIIFLFACFSILFFIVFIPINSPVLYFTDAIYSWNRWAIDWGSNKFPYDTAHYPQLFSANISLCYVFIQDTTVQFFPKVLMPLFCIGILLIFFDLSFLKKPVVNLTALILYVWILLFLYSLLFISDCNADIPATFLGFLAFYTILKQSSFYGKANFNSKTILLVVIFSIASANVKMAGLYILLLAFAWIMINVYENWNNISKVEIFKLIFFILIVFAGSFFWYIIKPVDMFNGLNQSPFLPANYFERFTNAVAILIFGLGPLLFVFLFLTILFSLFNKDSRYIVILIIAPILFLWAFFFSYDFRNLSIAFPFIAYASAHGIEIIYKQLTQNNFLNISGLKNVFILTPHSKINIRLWKYFFILLTISAIIILSTDILFNFGINLSYWLNRIYFRYHRIVYTFELGYYKSVEYYINASKVLCIVILFLFVLRKTKIKILHFIVLIVVSTFILNYSFLKRKNFISRQNHNKEMVIVHNLYYSIYPYIVNHEVENSIITNNVGFYRLIAPEHTLFKHDRNINLEMLSQHVKKNANTYLLLELKKLDKLTRDYIQNNIVKGKYHLQFDDGRFVFIKAASL